VIEITSWVRAITRRTDSVPCVTEGDLLGAYTVAEGERDEPADLPRRLVRPGVRQVDQ